MYVGRLDPQSNRATFQRQFEALDDDTDEPLDLTGLSIVFALRRYNGPHDYGHVFSTDSRSELTASTDNGKIVLIDVGVFQVTFTATDMKCLDAPATYDIGITISDDDSSAEYLIGTLPVLDGVVPR